MARRDTKFGRSRLEKPPRNVPGQHAAESANRILDETVVPWLVAIAAAVVIAVLEWLRLLDPTPHPIAATVFALLVFGVALWRAWPHMRNAQNYALGAEGERSVADVLHDLGRYGYVALHDIDTGQGNIDHVLIGPAGVFAIETKARTKSHERGKDRVLSNGDAVSINGGPFDNDPVRQARRNATLLGTGLREAGERDSYVVAALLYPEWWVESKNETDVWVMNPKNFFTRVRQADGSLNPNDVRRLASMIESLMPQRQGA